VRGKDIPNVDPGSGLGVDVRFLEEEGNTSVGACGNAWEGEKYRTLSLERFVSTSPRRC